MPPHLSVPAVGPSAAGSLAAAADAVSRLNDLDAAATLLRVLIRADAVASSQIEHITTSSEHLAVKLADLTEDSPDLYPVGTELVAANVSVALAAHRDRHDEVSAGWFHRMHRRLLASDRDLLRHHLGAWRDCAVWIGDNRGSADFEGPSHREVPQMMEDLVRFSLRGDVHPMLHAAIAHAQFETIHPYVDGNGRIGRLLIHKLLPDGPAPVPVAHGLLNDTARYVAGLNSYRAGDLGSWIEVFADAVSLGAHTAERLVARLDQIRDDYHGRVRSRRGSAVPRVIDALLDNPAVTARFIEDEFNVTPARATQILHRLADAQILQRSAFKAGRRNVWIASDVIDAVDTINATAPRMPRRTISKEKPGP